MQDKFEWLVKSAYRKWKTSFHKEEKIHPTEEEMVCFLEDRLSVGEKDKLKIHLLNCKICVESFVMQLKLRESQEKKVPTDLLAKVKNLARNKDELPFLEIFLKLKEDIFELINTTGDVLVGQELIPAVILRSRKIDKFKDEVTILKDFKDLRVEIKIENKPGKYFDLSVIAKDKGTSAIIKDLRITLIRDDLELASYLSESGKVIFEHINMGKYTVELSDIEAKLASILLEIKT